MVKRNQNLNQSKGQRGMLELVRIGSFPTGTLGRLYLNGNFLCYTMERQWKNNQPFISCVPDGEYELEDHNSDKWGKTFALVGGTVSHFKDPNFERYAILIHPGNFESDVQGCIAVGQTIAPHDHKFMVTDSRTTFQLVMEAVKDESSIIVRWMK